MRFEISDASCRLPKWRGLSVAELAKSFGLPAFAESLRGFRYTFL